MNLSKVCCYLVSQEYFFQWQLGLNDSKSQLLQYGDRKFKYTVVYIGKYNNFLVKKITEENDTAMCWMQRQNNSII